MRFTVVLHILAALVVAVSASPLATPHVVHERRTRSVSNWSKRGRLHSEAVFPIRIGLAQQNLHRAEEFINQVAHPQSKEYGQHWSIEKIAKTFEPSRETVVAVKSWLSSSGIDLSRVKTSQSRTWLTFHATAEEVETLLKAEYHVYEHETGATRTFQCPSIHYQL